MGGVGYRDHLAATSTPVAEYVEHAPGTVVDPVYNGSLYVPMLMFKGPNGSSVATEACE